MELYSLESIIEAKINGIEPMMSQEVFDLMDKKLICEILKKLEIQYLSLNSATLSLNASLHSHMIDEGIKIFSKNLEVDAGRGVDFVIHNENNLTYGMYTDDWVIKKPIFHFRALEQKSNKYIEDIRKLQQLKFVDYIKYLSNKEYTVMLVARDDASLKLSSQLKPLNSTINWKDKHRYSFVGLYHPADHFKSEFISNNLLEIESKHQVGVICISAGFMTGNKAEIYIDHTKIINSNSFRGLYVVVYDPKLKLVLDKCFFDTCLNSDPERNVIY